jgi:hypothetical protein
VGAKSLRDWRKRLRGEDQGEQRLVPLVVSELGVAVIVRLGAEPTMEIRDPARVPVEWVTELLRELTKGST